MKIINVLLTLSSRYGGVFFVQPLHCICGFWLVRACFRCGPHRGRGVVWLGNICRWLAGRGRRVEGADWLIGAPSVYVLIFSFRLGPGGASSGRGWVSVVFSLSMAADMARVLRVWKFVIFFIWCHFTCGCYDFNVTFYSVLVKICSTDDLTYKMKFLFACGYNAIFQWERK